MKISWSLNMKAYADVHAYNYLSNFYNERGWCKGIGLYTNPPHTRTYANFVMPSTEDVNRARSTLASKIETLGLSQERAKVLAKNVPEAELEPFMGKKTVDCVQYVADFMVKSF
jgi:hypothetical protein